MIAVKVTAYNEYGIGETSDPVATETIRTVPPMMAAPLRHRDTTTSKLVVVWDSLTSAEETGNSTLLMYNVQWDKGSDIWFNLPSAESTKIEIRSNVQPGKIYRVRVSAQNIYGNS